MEKRHSGFVHDEVPLKHLLEIEFCYKMNSLKQKCNQDKTNKMKLSVSYLSIFFVEQV